MKPVTSLLLLVTCVLTAMLVSACATSIGGAQKKAPETVIYLVRHAEKASSGTTAMMAADPALSEAGQQRAEALKELLANTNVAALLATKYQRTQQTLQPLAQAKKLPVQTYDASDFMGLAKKIRENYAGETVVVAGHSNTVLPIIEALGGKKPEPD